MVFKALEQQSDLQFEVVVADDGSNESSINQLVGLIEGCSLNVQHVWQEDLAFRKNRCLNLAVKAARSDYLIFIDGDCIPQKYFIEDHLDEAKPGHCLNGRRADLSAKMSELLKKSSEPARFIEKNRIKLIFDYLCGNGKNIEKGFRIKNNALRKYVQKNNKGLVGCNFSIYKKDLLKINGFDQRYEAAGLGEDSDIDYRLRLAGIKITSLFYKANQVHLHHKELPRSDVNAAIFAEVQKKAKYWTEYGITDTKHPE